MKSFYLLKNSAILNSDSIIHIFNEIIYFLNFWTAQSDDFLWTDNHKVSIQEYDEVDVKIQIKTDKHLMRFHKITFCKNFAVNLILLCQLHQLSYWWDNRLEFNHICKINQNYITVVILTELHEQNMLKYISVDSFIKTSFYNWWNYFNLWTECKSVTADVWIWHLRLKHVESQSL